MYGELDRFLVPLDSPSVRRWFNDNLCVPSTFIGRLRRAIGRPGLRRTPTVEGIAHFAALLEEVPDAVPRGPAIYVRDYEESDRGRVVAFFFPSGATEPAVVAKAQFPRRGRESLRIEAETLQQMQAFLPPSLQATLPKVLRFHESIQGELLVTSVLPGRSAYVEMRGAFSTASRIDAHFAAAARWLAAFHDATRSTATSTIAGLSIPWSAAHGDFWPRNMLHGPAGSIGVVDWEHFIPAASPFLDLFHYPLAYGISYYRSATAEEVFRQTFTGQDRLARAVRRYLRDYAALTGLPEPVLLPALRAFVQTEGRMHPGVPPRPGTASLPWAQFQVPG